MTMHDHPEIEPMTDSSSQTHHALVAAQFPLWGSRLIEASAGTGKTWTIAALYLRLVLGHGGQDNGFVRALNPSEILVMTFTKAATRELSDRIRARLMEAARCFRGEAAVDASDIFLLDLMADHPEGPVRNQAAWRLAMAAEGMDDAGVHTIDAWCQRMLREHAFDSGSLFDEELVADEASLLTQAVQDYWRRECYPLPAQVLSQLLVLWKDIPALTQDVSQLMRFGLDCLNATEQGRTLQGEMDAWVAHMQPYWVDKQRHIEAMRAWLMLEMTERRGHWHGTKLQDKSVGKWFDLLTPWSALDVPLSLPNLGTGMTRMTPSGLNDARTKAAPADYLMPESFTWFEQLVRQYEQNPIGPKLRRHAGVHVAQRLALLKRQTGTFGFADMLDRLQAALVGPHGERLRERILTQYPVALIDEFQDTSPLQYKLFDLVYQTQANAKTNALLLIGDPKQSIYGFRGADIYSYIKARLATEGRHYVLKVNYRSTQALVDAVNHCFVQAEVSRAQGAFMFKGMGEATSNPLPFMTVEAKGRTANLVSKEGPIPALTLIHDDVLHNASSVRQRFSERCAEQIVVWLNDPKAGFAQADGVFERLRPKDIAILVRTGKEAAAIRRSLQRRGVASVYLSDKDSVFQSQEARDLVHWLRGIANPQNAQLVRGALAIRTVGLSLDELGFLATDDDAFDVRHAQFCVLQTVWQGQGVLAMLRQSLHRFELAQSWLAQGDGERRLTNFLHLAELLQVASSALDGEQALIRWLVNQIAENAEQNEEQVIRLESDADLVKVITVHKSKGLEYPLVCLPFATSFREVTRQHLKSASLPDEQGQRELILDVSEAHVVRAEQERLREDVRLLYVALTRARHALWLGFASVKVGNSNACQSHKSAIGYLFGGQQMDTAAWVQSLKHIVQGRAGMVLVAASDTTARTPLRTSEEGASLRMTRPYAGAFDRDWGIASYSRITRDAKPQAPALAPMQVMRAADDEWRADAAADTDAALPQSRVPAAMQPPIWHSFKRGPVTGNFLHDQLEWLAADGFALVGQPEIAQRLQGRCERAGHAEQAPALVHWLQSVVSLPLPGPGVALNALGEVRAEMEFWLPTKQLDTRKVDDICQTHILPGVVRPALQASVLHGMLMGFADVVFEHAGRYWVLDYKSNHLGDDDRAYDASALASAVAQHRYDVQAAIYTLALDRLLKTRLGAAYHPAQHLGGAIYLFLRGIHGPCQGTCVITPALQGLAELDAMLGDICHD